ncbi:thioredoxin family protein [Alkalihalobacterium chitinilyticum]|uniref:Thioredoxin family protein n=1 Tax=Alkalihalobacterium chitinilyticum TaxID=2980103 RepID=A0ABT5VAM2_9BACI|nr:thioredoxin family protein [Alkalihalobacterium chitinilyticum]MDE5412490.1 thioredoxin family protein [Alkalihalobacterium chitinilyticum]
MKKIIIFLVVVVGIFAALAVVNNASTSKKVEGNPYGKSNLNQLTINQLDDPNYQNIILPDELTSSLEDGESMTVYFYQPTCPACVEASPIIVPMTADMGIDLKLYNLLEFNEGWSGHNIQSTPTIVHYENGQELGRVEGLYSEEEYRSWFEQVKALN